MLLLIHIYHLVKISLRWKKAKKRGDGLFVKIGNLNNFFNTLHSNRVNYVVLRGLCEDSSFLRTKGDVDILTKSSDVKKIIWAAATNPGETPFDVYFNDRPSVKKYHYYPPIFANKILENKIIYPNQNYYVPEKKYQLLSLLYHVTYHKGILESYHKFNDDYYIETSSHYENLRRLCYELDIDLSLSLLKIHFFLKAQGFSMPFDLILKWPNQHNLLKIIHDKHAQELQINNHDNISFPLIFIVRSDASDQRSLDLILSHISKKMKVTDFFKLSKLQIENVSTFTRGGNWIERVNGTYKNILPSHLIKTEFLSLDQLNIFCKNELSHFKKTIRDALKKDKNNQIFGLHSADNYLESLEYIEILNYESI